MAYPAGVSDNDPYFDTPSVDDPNEYPDGEEGNVDAIDKRLLRLFDRSIEETRRERLAMFEQLRKEKAREIARLETEVNEIDAQVFAITGEQIDECLERLGVR